MECVTDCLGNPDCTRDCLSGDDACTTCIVNNNRYCALTSESCGRDTRDWICCLESTGCYERAFDEDCQASCNPEPYLACLEASRCDEIVNACFF